MTAFLAFFLNSALLGVGLAMDAFSVSAVSGLREPEMKPGRMALIAGTFGFFQFLMPMAGWFCVHTILEYFRIFERFIPWIALALLLWIGGSMLLEGLREMKRNTDTPASDSPVLEDEARGSSSLTAGSLLLQGIATSIDALSVGFTIAGYTPFRAFAGSLIIAAVTFVICIGGIKLGKTFGTRLSDKASILGGLILIAIGLEIFLTSALPS